MTEKTKLTFLIEKELHKELKKRAIDEERTVTEIVTKLITDYLQK